MMEITTNKPIDNNTLNIVKDSFEEQKGVTVLSIYAQNDNIYGIYLNNLRHSLSFIEAPLYSMNTDIDGHDIFMIELGTLLHLSYHNGMMQMYRWLCHPSDIKIDNTLFDDLIQYCNEKIPLDLASFYLIQWVEMLNNDDLTMSVSNLVDMFQSFMQFEPLDIDLSDLENEIYLKNQLNEGMQILKSKKYNTITESNMRQIDKYFIDLQIDSI